MYVSVSAARQRCCFPFVPSWGTVAAGSSPIFVRSKTTYIFRRIWWRLWGPASVCTPYINLFVCLSVRLKAADSIEIITAPPPQSGFVRSKTTHISGNIGMWSVLWGPFWGPVTGQRWCFLFGPFWSSRTWLSSRCRGKFYVFVSKQR
jgi:hypothetical protein